MTKTKKQEAVEKWFVPMIVGGHVLPEGIEHKKTSLTVEKLHRQYLVPGRLDLEPPYQRDAVWTQKQQRNFIQSCFNPKMAIPPFYIAEKRRKRGATLYTALDCRQRSTAIRDFFQDKFWVYIFKSVTTGGTTKVKRFRMKWSEIESNDDLFRLREIFLNREIEMVEFSASEGGEAMGYEDQAMIFDSLNSGTPLNNDEVNYCTNYLARRVLDEAFVRVFKSEAVIPDEGDGFGPGLASMVQASTRNGVRFRHLRVMHELLILAASLQYQKGPNDSIVLTTQPPQPRSCKRKDRERSAFGIHHTLKAMDFEYEDDLTAPVLEAIKIKNVLPVMTELADQLAAAFRSEGTLGRVENQSGNFDPYLLPRNVIDPLAFLYTIVTEGHATLDKIKMKVTRPRLVKWLASYYSEKTKQDLNSATSDELTMAGKFRIMRTLWNKEFGTNIPEWPAERKLKTKKSS